MNAQVDITPRLALRNLSAAAYANGWTLWHYRAASIADVTVPGFWADAVMLKVGDHIAVSAPDGGAMLIYMPSGEVEIMAARGVVPVRLAAE